MEMDKYRRYYPYLGGAAFLLFLWLLPTLLSNSQQEHSPRTGPASQAPAR